MTAETSGLAIRPAVADIIADIFQYEGALTPDTGPEQIERWDSLQHIALVRALEQEFGIALTMDEMMEIRRVGDIEVILERYGVA